MSSNINDEAITAKIKDYIPLIYHLLLFSERFGTTNFIIFDEEYYFSNKLVNLMIPDTILFVIILSIMFSFVENKSNFPNIVMIPIIVGSITKYILGDWDTSYAWTISDIFYWFSIIGFSIITVIIINKIKQKNKCN